VLTSQSFVQIKIGSAWTHQTIGNANPKTKVKPFKCLPLETNHQNWTLHQAGETYSVLVGLLRGVKKRILMEMQVASHQDGLNALLEGRAKAGSIKLFRSRKNIGYACISVSMEVPDAETGYVKRLALSGSWIKNLNLFRSVSGIP
jgi:hypothetical protein